MTTPEPYYADDLITLYHGDAAGFLLAPPDEWSEAVVVTDPPYGISFHSNSARREGGSPRSIANDGDTAMRDLLVSWLGPKQPALVFGSPRIPKPGRAKGTLIWDKGPALGMGDLSLPWKFNHEEIYVIGSGFEGRRDCGSVIQCSPVQAVGRNHPHEKPIDLMVKLLEKCGERLVLDPFCGSGTTLVAAKRLGLRAVGIESEETYCRLAAVRLGSTRHRMPDAEAQLDLFAALDQAATPCPPAA